MAREQGELLHEAYIARSVTDACEKLATYGFVLIENGVPHYALDKLREQIVVDYPFYQSMRCLDRERFPSKQAPRRFCMNSAANWSKAAWRDFVAEVLYGMTGDVVMEMLGCREIDAIGGDVVCAHFDQMQPLHEDWPSCPTRAIPMCLSASVAVADVLPENGAMRIVPDPWRRAGGFYKPPGLGDEPLQWQRNQLSMKKGSVLLRDVNTWHGGCPNISNSDRVLPAVRFLSWHSLRTVLHRPHRCLPDSCWQLLDPIVRYSTTYLWYDDGCSSGSQMSDFIEFESVGSDD